MIIYREASENDLPQIAKLYNQLAFELQAVTSDDYFDFELLSDEAVCYELKKAYGQSSVSIYVAVEGNTIVGFITSTVVPCFLPVSRVGKVGYIDAAFVLESHRGKNIMGELEKLQTGYFKRQGMKFVELNVLTANINGKHFWNKHNYQTFREQMRKSL